MTRRGQRSALALCLSAAVSCRDGSDPVAATTNSRLPSDRPAFQIAPKAANWTRLSPVVSPPARVNHAMATGPNGVFVFGGEGPSGPLNDLWQWNGTNWTLVLSGKLSAPSPRIGAAMAYDPVRQRLVLTGGCDHSVLPARRFFDTWELNPLSKSGPAWVVRSSLLPADTDPCYATMAYDSSFQELVLVLKDGRNPNNQYVWNGSTWSAIQPLGVYYLFHGLAFHQATGTIVMCCGVKTTTSDLFGLSNDTWVGHAGRFAQRSPIAIAPQEAWQILTPYPPGGSLLLFGGPNPTTRGGSQRGYDSFAGPASWTGTQWVLLQFAFPSPAGRITSMAYDAAHGNIVLFGGLNASGFHSDTWTWGRQVACVPLEGAEVPVGTSVECFFKLGTGVDLVHWDADGFAPKHRTTTTARFHPTGPGPAVVRVTWTGEEGEQSTEIRFTIAHPHAP